jgi:D-sedoheptulose 7-phosphate isomerase
MGDLIRAQFNSHIETAKNTRDILLPAIEESVGIIIDSFRKGGTLYACGNGGSTCDAMHLAEELVGRYKNDRKPLPAHHLMDPSLMTCWSNDVGYADVFRRQVEAYGKQGDVLVAISTSGNSENCIYAVAQAGNLDMKTINLLGKGGGKMKGTGNVDIIIPSTITARIQEMHTTIIHTWLETIEKKLGEV